MSWRTFDWRNATITDWLVFADQLIAEGHPAGEQVAEALRTMPATRAVRYCLHGLFSGFPRGRRRSEAEVELMQLRAELRKAQRKRSNKPRRKPRNVRRRR